MKQEESIEYCFITRVDTRRIEFYIVCRREDSRRLIGRFTQEEFHREYDLDEETKKED